MYTRSGAIPVALATSAIASGLAASWLAAPVGLAASAPDATDAHPREAHGKEGGSSDRRGHPANATRGAPGGVIRPS
ncbi:hypothetical protein ACFXP7_04390 [Microbacterium sp. P06]|uniref:hypothetical protein n=1 Tax=Microbacterium sp. P06 TaxID=3366949 RepID=UPI0037460ECC